MSTEKHPKFDGDFSFLQYEDACCIHDEKNENTEKTLKPQLYNQLKRIQWQTASYCRADTFLGLN